MSDFEGVVVTRADIARYAGVKRPAVTNWERRHADFPRPLEETVDAPSGVEVFSAAEVLAWLAKRIVPANARQPGEPEGTTYGDRFRLALGGPRSGALLKAVDLLSGQQAERFRGELSQADHLTVLLSLVYLRGCRPEEWQRIVAEASRYQFSHSGGLLVRFLASAVREGLGTMHEQLLLALSQNLGDVRLADMVRLLDDTGPVDRGEHAVAFEKLLARYSDLLGKRAGDFFTPRAAVEVIAGVIAEGAGDVHSVHDPFIRAGELVSAAWEAVTAVQQTPGSIEVSGAGVGEHPLALAGMNLALHGIPDAGLWTGDVAPAAGGGPWQRDALTFDRVVTNPPFNVKFDRPVDERNWRYGPPPRHNANFAWLQHAVTSLKPGGRAAVIMPDIAAFSANPSERRIRAAMVEDGAVEALIALPAQLFASTGISVTVWLLRYPTGLCDEILFVDASHFGSLTTRVRRELSPDELRRIHEEHRSWSLARAEGRAFAGTDGLSRAVPIEKLREMDYTLSPAFHVPRGRRSDTRSADRTDLVTLARHLAEVHARTREADAAAEELLERYGL
ncbi:N-6 DNA methylase [Streptomyces lavenduligriseus]|uniref:SAM-dependent methyltransferase n=1 Tax=Streptomyces lavenduligriseus TaxID=67315 RepID=A0ABT0NS09_9ACTN|nr:N-6 DNA methylase [Streptomyces lavenduligriseus]MCL3994248.1 SAM-dependent methyltransferase [Streptomyces lavenduligriseus]